MMKNGKRVTLFGAVFALAATLMLLTGVIRFFAGSAFLWKEELERFATAEEMGFPASEYPAMAEHIAEYLAGRKDSFQYTLMGRDGSTYLCFHDYELIHMADCRGLIHLDEVVCIVCSIFTLMIGTWAICLRLKGRHKSVMESAQDGYLHRESQQGSPETKACPQKMDMRIFQRGAITALRVLGIFTAGLMLWAVINFDGFFITFHRIAFRNDYWLLNPRTDLLIRLMPEGLFIDLGFKGLGCFAAGIGLEIAFLHLISKHH